MKVGGDGENVGPIILPGFLDNTCVKVKQIDCVGTLAKLFSQFKGQKVQLVKSIGFDGLLSLPLLSSVDDKFYVWLLSKIDATSSCFRLDDQSELPIRDEDINLVFGIPCTGADVISSDIECISKVKVSMIAVNQVRNIIFSGNEKACFTLEYIEHILGKEYNSAMTKSEIDAFKIAVVIYAMSHVLAINGSRNKIPVEIFESLMHPDNIKSVN